MHPQSDTPTRPALPCPSPRPAPPPQELVQHCQSLGIPWGRPRDAQAQAEAAADAALRQALHGPPPHPVPGDARQPDADLAGAQHGGGGSSSKPSRRQPQQQRQRQRQRQQQLYSDTPDTRSQLIRRILEHEKAAVLALWPAADREWSDDVVLAGDEA